jgi:hypothetical protein
LHPGVRIWLFEELEVELQVAVLLEHYGH